MRYMLARIWHVIWGLPQTVVGCAMFLALRRSRRHVSYRSATVTEWRLRSGLSMGMFIFVPEGSTRALLAHEYGHTLQSLMLGPFYLPVIVVPSLIWAGLPQLERMRVRRSYSYYRFSPERWANALSLKVTGVKPEGWYDR